MLHLEMISIIGRVEMVRGSVATLCGTGAASGAINLIGIAKFIFVFDLAEK